MTEPPRGGRSKDSIPSPTPDPAPLSRHHPHPLPLPGANFQRGQGGGGKRICGRYARSCSDWGLAYPAAAAAGARRIPLAPWSCDLREGPQSLPTACALLTDDDGAGAHQPDLFLERHPLRGARAGSGTRGRRGHRARIPAPSRLLYVACHVAVTPHSSSLLYPVRPARRQSVGRSVCRFARSRGQRPQAGACAGTGPGPPGAPERLNPRRDGRRASRQPPSPSALKGNCPFPPTSLGGQEGTWIRVRKDSLVE